MAVIKVYIIPTCTLCAAYIETLRSFCSIHGMLLEIYDIDSDPLESIKYLREYRGCSTSIPFLGIYDTDGKRINCISGVHTVAELETLYEQYRRPI
jgi:hypothetical protein